MADEKNYGMNPYFNTIKMVLGEKFAPELFVATNDTVRDQKFTNILLCALIEELRGYNRIQMQKTQASQPIDLSALFNAAMPKISVTHEVTPQEIEEAKKRQEEFNKLSDEERKKVVASYLEPQTETPVLPFAIPKEPTTAVSANPSKVVKPRQ